MKILVTGSAGFVGFHLCRRLLADEGVRVLGLDNISDYYSPQLKEDRLAALPATDRFRFVRGDIADSRFLGKLFAKFQPDYVLHMAAQAGVRYSIEHPEAYLQSNVTGFFNILEACRQNPVRHLVFASSSSIYGATHESPFHEDQNTDHPVSFYAATKKSNEVMAHAYSHLYDIPVTGLRFFTVYGPWGRPDMAPMLFARAISEGKPIPVFNHGKMRRDFTYVDDIAEGVLRTMTQPPAPEAETGRAPTSARYDIYNIGNHQPVELLDFIRTLEKHLGRKAILDLQPMQPGDMVETCADVSRLRAATGFNPSTSLDDGLRRFVAWFREYYGEG